MRRQTLYQRCGLIIAALFILPSLDAQRLYVDAAATGNGSGTSWQNAHVTLQAALSVAPGGAEIFVAAGRYTGGFVVPAGVAVYGGFAPGDTRMSQREPFGNRPTFLDGAGTQRVLQAGNAARIDGFVIENGRGGSQGGGALLCEGTAPILSNCLLTGNQATALAHAVHCGPDSSGTPARPQLVNCLIARNGSSTTSLPTVLLRGGRSQILHCGLADNQGDGLAYGQAATVDCRNTYLVRNSARGIDHRDSQSTAQLRHLLFFANATAPMRYLGQDLNSFAAVQALNETSRCLSSDPRFPAVTPPVYSFPPGSPLVDAGEDFAGLPLRSLGGSARQIDGDWNGTSTPDIGPIELLHNRLLIQGTPAPGATVDIGVFGFSSLPTTMGIGFAPAPTPLRFLQWGLLELDFSGPVLVTGWAPSGSALRLTIPASLPSGVTICLQNVVANGAGVNLSNLLDIRLR